MPLAVVESMELWAALLSLAGAIGAALAFAGRFLIRHFGAMELQQAAFTAAIIADHKEARAEARTENAEARRVFAQVLADQTSRQVEAIKTLEAECSAQRVEDRKMIARLAGVDTGSWKAPLPGTVPPARKTPAPPAHKKAPPRAEEDAR